MLLMEADCVRYLAHLRKRDRNKDEHPIPFVLMQNVCESSKTNDSSDGSNAMKPETTVHTDTSSISGTDCTEEEKNKRGIQNDNVERNEVPLWKCYVKATSYHHVFLTFIPAGFKDLLILNSMMESHITSEKVLDTTKSELSDPFDHSESRVDNSDGEQEVGEDLSPKLNLTETGKESETSRSIEKDLVIPVYTYSCSLYDVVDSLVDRWNFQLSPDCYEDFSFDKCQTSTRMNSVTSPRGRLSSFDVNIEAQQREDDIYSARMWRSSLDRRSTESMADSTSDFKQLCKTIAENYFTCFVMGVYQSLQQNFYISRIDFDAAISNICEESLPLETDVTSFLHTSCGHFKHYLESSRRSEDSKHSKDFTMSPRSNSKEGEEDMDALARKQCVRFSDIMDDEEEGNDEEDNLSIPRALQHPKYSFTIQLPLPKLERTCEYTHHLHKIIQEKFQGIMSQWFTVVPTCKDYYFFHQQTSEKSVFEDGKEAGDTTDQGHESSFKDPGDSNTDILISEYVDMKDIYTERKSEDSFSIASNLDSESYLEADLSLSLDDETVEQTPLFLHFTCTVKCRDHYNISLQTLPTCLGSLENAFVQADELDLSCLKITFDLICLTLPNENEVVHPRKASFLRVLSNTSTDTFVETDTDTEEVLNFGPSDFGLPKVGICDPITHLPKAQHEAVYKFKEQLESLLKDEVVSAMRYIYPINVDTLQFVTKHISQVNEAGKTGCAHVKIPLKFVFGPEKSMIRFKEEFERMKLLGYKLMVDGGFYYLALPGSSNGCNGTIRLDLSRNQNNHIDSCEHRGSGTDDKSIASKSPRHPSGLSDDIDPHAPAKQYHDSSNTPSTPGKPDDLPRKMSAPLPTDIQPDMLTNSIIADDMFRDSSLKKSSSFAGFQCDESDQSGDVGHPVVRILSSSPIKTVGSAPHIAVGRFRHSSAPSGQHKLRPLDTAVPDTPSWISSRGSLGGEDGYEGDFSDPEDGDMLSVSDSEQRRPKMPNFWLIMQIEESPVNLYFHTRVPNNGENDITKRQKDLLSDVTGKIENICRRVNQQLLLDDLFTTRMCDKLLVPEADEDVTWGKDSLRRAAVPNLHSGSSADEDEEEIDGTKYLYDAMDENFEPGHFACDCVWTTSFQLHSKLKSGTQMSSSSRGITALRSRLNPFSVNNRKNMFVYREASSQNVFYLRLKETVASSRHMSFGGDDFLNESTGSLGFGNFKRDEDLKLNEAVKAEDQDGDTLSVTSTGSKIFAKEEILELSVHGITDAGQEIKEDLIAALQKKLDDAILDSITLTLSRNPLSKLSPEDVSFIQRPREPAKSQLRLKLPGYTVQLLHPVMYYLRQNLKQFLHPPKYTDSNPYNHFQDIIDGNVECLRSGDIFLYIRPGSKGIACISLALVNSQGGKVEILGGQKPHPNGHTTIKNSSEFETLIATEVYEPDLKKKTPEYPERYLPLPILGYSILADDDLYGPTSLIQFRIWERGQIDSTSLQKLLIKAVRNSLCDIIMEYRLLTAPICQISLQDVVQLSPAYSAPPSPSGAKESDKDLIQMLVARKLSDVTKPIPKQPSSPLQTIKDVFSSRNRVSSPTIESSKQGFDIPSTPSQQPAISSTWQEGSFTNLQTPESELEKTIHEIGDKGNLHSVYITLMTKWLEFCRQQDVPSVNKVEMYIQSRYSLDFVLEEFKSSFSTVSSDIVPQIFKLIPAAINNDASDHVVGYQYIPHRHPVTNYDSSESSLDCKYRRSNITGHDLNFIVVGRNMQQWYRSLYDISEKTPIDGGTKIERTHQKFQPYFPGTKDPKDGEQTDVQSSDGKFVIPRQRLLFLLVKNNQLTLYLYNMAGDITTSLVKLLTNLVQWHNSRSHLNNSIIAQKMGLFQHYFVSNAKCKDANPFTASSGEIDLYLRNTNPARDAQKRHNSVSTMRSMTHLMGLTRSFEDTYKDMQPLKNIHKCAYANEKDVFKKYGLQAIEVRKHYSKETDKLVKLQSELYSVWFQSRPGSVSVPVVEDYLVVLKQASRLLHHCSTPLIFSNQWRQNVMRKGSAIRKNSFSGPSQKADTKSVRSRHSSGTSANSVKTKRSHSLESRKKAAGLSDSIDGHKNNQEEIWHFELRLRLVSEYKQYLQDKLGFVYVHTRPASVRKSVIRTSSGKSAEKPDIQDSVSKPSMVNNLQKTLAGGIMLIEISFRNEYFCVKLYACPGSHMGMEINKQLKLMFIDECERLMEDIHVHSFTHDFHLRCVQSYLMGNSAVLKTGYHLTSFLSDFNQIFPSPPSYSRNCLYRDSKVMKNLTCSGHQLYDFMLSHFKLSDLKVLQMSPLSEPDLEAEYYLVKENEHALVSFKKSTITVKEKVHEYNIGLVIYHDPSLSQSEADKNCMGLKYFIILSSVMELFPFRQLESKFAKRVQANIKTRLVEQSGPFLGPDLGHPSRQEINSRKEATDYLGYSNMHQTHVFALVKQETEIANKTIEDMVNETMEKCRRDSLWQRMIIGQQPEDENKRKKRTDTEESSDAVQPHFATGVSYNLSKLSFEEFCELLSMVTKKPLKDVDKTLFPFQNMNITWYKSLIHVLNMKYSTATRRTYISSDGLIHYVVILNPKYLDTLMLLYVDLGTNKAEICAVEREPAADGDLSSSEFSRPVLDMQEHFEGFVNTCCFHLWSSIL